MTDALFFTLSDIQDIRKVSVNIDDFDLYAQETQRNFVQKLLGTKLYLLLVDNLSNGIPQDIRFTNLVNGSRYTIGNSQYIHRGIKMYACYIWLYNYVLESETNITPLGVRLFEDEASQLTDIKQIRAHYIRSAKGIEDGIVHFLQNNLSSYPEFSEASGQEPAEENSFSFKVIGNRYTPPNEFTDLL